MIQRITSAALLIPLVLLSIFYLPPLLFLCLIEVLLWVALWEYLRLCSACGTARYGVIFPAVLLLPWIWNYRAEWTLPYLMAVLLVLAVRSVIRTADLKRGLPWAATHFLALFYLGVPFALGARLQHSQPRSLVLVLVVIWASDIAAFLAGKTWGRHRVTPRLSPSKTVEGYLAGLGAGTAAALLAGRSLELPGSVLSLALLGVTLTAAGIFGDLFESLLKRGAEVKDSSHLIPGHGGLLDRVDSLLFALLAYGAFSFW